MIAPLLMAKATARDLRPPMYLPAGGSNPFGALGYVEASFELAAQVAAGDLPAPATVVTAVGSGGTAAGLALGLKLAGLDARVNGIVVNDALRLDPDTIAWLANESADLLRGHGAELHLAEVGPNEVTMRNEWLGTTYGDPTPASLEAVAAAATHGLTLEPVYTGKALAAIRDLADTHALAEPILWLNTHGPR
jgi:D-cysteine desulfhydrase